ncbi:MAG: CPXCG motif-containing cysteine-rich protein [Gammaproteobacteria bacterium]|nr:CPXCG motif-containing cysteine-rich protein [Gammaproteobacteria bacterium]
MNELESKDIQCPYCGEIINVVIDCSVSQQSYIEDCQVCCRPINFDVLVDQETGISVSVSSDND